MNQFLDEYAMLEVECSSITVSDKPLTELRIRDLRPFLPSNNFSMSKDFYRALGCSLEWEDADLALFELAGQRFYLQRYFVKEWAENCMLHFSVEDAGACYREIQKILESGRYPTAKVAEPRLEPYGALVTYVWDPSGVLLLIEQKSLGESQQG